MREVMDEGLQRLYWACRSTSGFPGDVPDESQGPPSTTAILSALGLKIPSLQDTGPSENIQKSVDVFPSNFINYAEGSRRRAQTVPSSPGGSSMQDECLPSPATLAISCASTGVVPSFRSSSTPILVSFCCIICMMASFWRPVPSASCKSCAIAGASLSSRLRLSRLWRATALALYLLTSFRLFSIALALSSPSSIFRTRSVGFLACNDHPWVCGVDASNAIGRVGRVGSALNTVAVVSKTS